MYPAPWRATSQFVPSACIFRDPAPRITCLSADHDSTCLMLKASIPTTGVPKDIVTNAYT
eukprot:4368492-Amphidinium_carterae.1